MIAPAAASDVAPSMAWTIDSRQARLHGAAAFDFVMHDAAWKGIGAPP